MVSTSPITPNTGQTNIQLLTPAWQLTTVYNSISYTEICTQATSKQTNNKTNNNKTKNPTSPTHIKTIFKKNTCTIFSLEPEWWMDYTFLLCIWLNSILATTFTLMFRPTSLTRDGNNRETMFECRRTLVFLPNIKVRDTCHWPLKSLNEKKQWHLYRILMVSPQNRALTNQKELCHSLRLSMISCSHCLLMKTVRRRSIFRPSRYHEQWLQCGFIFGILKISYFGRVRMQTK